MHSRNKGFTLVELLVVISIILIASSIIFVGSGSGDGTKLSASQRILAGIAQGARGQAILKNAPTRLIIYSENNAQGDPEKFLRFFGIVYLRENAVDANGIALPDGWVAATQGTYLPEGVYFDPDLSSNNNWAASNTMNVEFPLFVRLGEYNSQLAAVVGPESSGTDDQPVILEGVCHRAIIFVTMITILILEVPIWLITILLCSIFVFIILG